MKSIFTLGAFAGALMLAGTSAQALSVLSIAAADCDMKYGAVTGATADLGQPNGASPVLAGDDCGQYNNVVLRDGRRQAIHAIDGDSDTFFSLGLGGGLLLDVTPPSAIGAAIIEITYNNAHTESADVYFLYGGAQVGAVQSIGNATQTIQYVMAEGLFDQIKIIDTSPLGLTNGKQSQDGFDIASITVVPLPAGILLLGTALAGLGAIRRRA